MNKLMMIGLVGFLGVSTTALAESGHDMHQMHDMKHNHAEHGQQQAEQAQNAKVFLVKKDVDGYTVTFHVMEPTADMQHGGSHNLMIKLEHGQHAIDDAAINSKVFYPDGSSASKMLMLMDGWYMNGYDFQGDAKHGLMILFKTADGKKHKASVYYPKGE